MFYQIFLVEFMRENSWKIYFKKNAYKGREMVWQVRLVPNVYQWYGENQKLSLVRMLKFNFISLEIKILQEIQLFLYVINENP